MAKKLSDILTDSTVDDADYTVMVHDNGDGTFNDYRKQTKIILIISGTSTSLTNAFFSNTISEIVTQGICYIAGESFSQSGTTITWTNGGSFIDGAYAIFKL